MIFLPHNALTLRPASENSVLHTVTIKIITLQILFVKIWIIYHFTAKWILYYNKIILSLLCQIITVILLAERHPKKYVKNKRTLPFLNNYWADRFPTSSETNVAIHISSQIKQKWIKSVENFYFDEFFSTSR